MSKFCGKCGHEIEENIKFCTNCGASTEKVIPLQNVSTMECGQTVMDKPKSKKKIIPIIIGIVAVVVVLIAVVMSGGLDFNKQFGDLKGKEYCTISKDGDYMEIDSNPKDIEDYYAAGTGNAIKEIHEKLDIPDSVYPKMQKTRALDGVQTYKTKKVEITWRYHPDKGLEVIYEKIK